MINVYVVFSISPSKRKYGMKRTCKLVPQANLRSDMVKFVVHLRHAGSYNSYDMLLHYSNQEKHGNALDC